MRPSCVTDYFSQQGTGQQTTKQRVQLDRKMQLTMFMENYKKKKLCLEVFSVRVIATSVLVS